MHVLCIPSLWNEALNVMNLALGCVTLGRSDIPRRLKKKTVGNQMSLVCIASSSRIGAKAASLKKSASIRGW